MEENILKSLHPFDLPKVEIQPWHLDERSGLRLSAAPFDFLRHHCSASYR
jgi:hypothetical protein